MPLSEGTEEDVNSGTNIVTKEAAIPERFLDTPLDERQKPSQAEYALEVAAFWDDSCIDSVQVRGNRAVTVGPNKGSDLRVAADASEKFTIAQTRDSSSTIRIPGGSKVAIRTKDGRVDKNPNLNQGGDFSSVELNMGDRVVFKDGTVTFVAQYVRGNAAMGASGANDWTFLRFLTIVFLLHLFFVVAALITPITQSSLLDDLYKNQNRFAQMILKAPEKKERPKLDLAGMKSGERAKDKEGKFGKKDKPKKDKAASKKGAPRVDPNKREKDRKIAMNAGLLGILKGAQGSGAVSNVFGPGGLGSGINNAMGGMSGTSMGDAGGAGGLGTRGTGAGGGGSALGIGGLGGHGHGRGRGGYGNINLGGRGKGRARLVPGRTIIKGSLSKAEINRVIRRNLARFKYCYEKQLNKNPNLSGKVSVYFTIAPTGSVANASVSKSTIGNATVEGCVTRVMRSLKFPKPKGGGIVVVTYPFVFAST